MSKVRSQLMARDGIALIIVLGMLALMVLMGVTFSIYMRTERVAAGNFRNDVAVRQLLHVALNRALEDVGGSVGTGLYPSWDILPSDSGSDSFSNAITATALEWIPRAALGTNLNPELRWIDVATGSRTEGRVGYLVVNCSGLLDANHAGGLPASDRLSGTNAAELQIETLTEVADQTRIPQGRAYETVQELGVVGLRNGTFSRHPEHFTTFSAFPTGSVVDISGTVQELLLPANKARIIEAFASLGPINTLQAGTLFTNLIDYVDEDSIPGNLGNPASAGIPNGPFVEPIWFCNEVSFSNRITYSYDADKNETAWTNRMWFQYEWFFPFKGMPAAAKNGFKAEIRVTTDGGPMFATAPAPYVHMANRPAAAATLGFYAPGPILMMAPNNGVGSSPGSLPLNLSVTATIEAKVFKNNILVDVVTNVLSITNTINQAAGTHTTAGWDGRECKDPRLNHLAIKQIWRRPPSGAPSMSAMNSFVQELWVPPSGDPKALDFTDGDLEMYVRNGRLESVGELGYLFYGREGETIRLYQHGTKLMGRAHRVLDNFVTSGTGTRSLKGRVNLNNRNADVLACVFSEAPIDYPHGDKTKRVSGALLDGIVNAILAQGGSFTNLSDLGKPGIDWKSLYPTGSDQDRESLIRNSAGLLHPRQNLFTILLFAQLTRNVEGVSDKSVVADVRAVAEVWRDPIDNAYLVRSLKILNE